MYTIEGLIAGAIILIPLILTFIGKSSSVFLIGLSIGLILLPYIILLLFNNTLLLIFAPALEFSTIFGLVILSITAFFYDNIITRGIVINIAISISVLYFIIQTLKKLI